MVFQPAFTIGGGGMELNIWGNMDLTDDYDNQFNFTEVDYTLSYGQELDAFAWTVGVITYDFPNTDFASTSEAYVGVSLTKVLFSPSATLYYDFDFGLSAGLLIGYGCEDYVGAYFAHDNVADAAFTHFAASVDYPITLKAGELNFNLTFTDLLDSNIHTPGLPDDDANLVAGVGWSYSF